MADNNLTVDTNPTPTEYPFVHWIGEPAFVSEHLQPLIRPGVDGQDFRVFGAWCEPFELVSVETATSVAVARALLAVYDGFKEETDAISLDYLGATLGNVQILDVMQQELKAAYCIIGGYFGAGDVASGGNGYILKTKWSMVFV